MDPKTELFPLLVVLISRELTALTGRVYASSPLAAGATHVGIRAIIEMFPQAPQGQRRMRGWTA